MDKRGTSDRDHQDLPGPADGGGERRKQDRYRTVCRVARVTRAHDVGLWRVRNLSDAGAMLSADVAVRVGERVEIALSETIRVAGMIAWGKQGRYGVAFDTSIDAAAMLKRLGDEQRAEGYRALRLPFECEALVVLAEGTRPIDLVDLSQQGAGYSYAAALEPGTELELLLKGGTLQRRAIVRWSRGARGGLWFTIPLDRADLESVLHLRR
ncbi:PilZ domain-containing protein [Sphingopyxis fribergensis]